MKTTLPTLSDYIYNHPASMDYEWVVGKFLTYTYFLRQELKLWMFIPCNDKGKPLVKPIPSYYGLVGVYEDNTQKDIDDYERECKEYQKADSKRLFEGFKRSKGYGELADSQFAVISNEYYLIFEDNGNIFSPTNIKSIQDLTNKVELTQEDKKELGL